MKPCTRCGLERDRAGKSMCRGCEAERARERRQEAPERHRAVQAARIYGVRVDQVLAWREESECDICGCLFDGVLAIDHCHTTGIIRGILCPGCNTFLGKLERRLGMLDSYLDYLRGIRPKHEARTRDQAHPTN